MASCRLVRASHTEVIATAPPFSNFDFVDRHFGGTCTIRRLFSQARCYGGQSIVVEAIRPVGAVEEDNRELRGLFSDFEMTGLLRLTFWKHKLGSKLDLRGLSSESLLGFAILKRDVVPSQGRTRWYVFESVMVKFPHAHNCVPGEALFHVRVGKLQHTVRGTLYCQQNGLNKACAQVALRAVLGTRRPDDEISYSQINGWAFKGDPNCVPRNGLLISEIRDVLHGAGICFYDIDYTQRSAEERERLSSYQRLVYAGVESGGGALLVFSKCGEGMDDQGSGKHIVPIFGHTFNQDTWVPRAEASYFHVGEDTKYLPSETWVSSFIGHDDNFGSNLCIPRQYMGAERADYVAELFRDGCVYSGAYAEAIAVEYLYSILRQHLGPMLPWLDRLVASVTTQEVVLRAVCLPRHEYVHHLRNSVDWEGHHENPDICEDLSHTLPEIVWMVEVSMPELFPANQHKVGEIVLDATTKPSPQVDFSHFVHARLPGRFIFFRRLSPDGTPSFYGAPSRLESHSALFVRSA